jgi:hypothetical protein
MEGRKRITQKKENATLLLISLSAFDYKRYEAHPTNHGTQSRNIKVKNI